MPAIFAYAIGIFILLLCAYGGIAFLRQSQKKKQYEQQISALTRDLADANARLGKQEAEGKTIRESSQYEKSAGMTVARMDKAVMMIGQNRTVTFINDYARQYLDLAASAGMPYKDVVHIHAAGKPDDDSLLEAAFAGTVQQIPDAFELTSQRGTFPITGTILPLTASPPIPAVALIFEDSSKQVARVKEEQAFFSAAAHELRTPLTVIRMTASLLKDNFDSMPKEKITEHLRRTDETAQQLVTLVNEFLNVSRIDQGRLELKTEKFDMVTLTDEVIRSLALLAKERKLYVNHEIDVAERMAVGDRAKSAEVLSNLISNGLKYTIQGGLTISHSATSTTITTTVTDTGPGISHERQSLLFKRFGQVGEARQQSPAKSSGLGLYISKMFAKLMRGDVVLVKSEPGTGSVFAFILPLR